MKTPPEDFRDKAIIALVGESVSYDTDGDTIIKWHSKDVPQPSEADINAKAKEYETEWNNDYARKREEEYPSIQECVHAILDDDLTALQEKRQAVKTKYPKS
jgi:hypothetical protein